MPTGMFDQAAHVSYKGESWRYGPTSNLQQNPNAFPRVRQFERFVCGLKPINKVDGISVPVRVAPRGSVYLVLVDIQGIHSFKQVRGTSRANTATAFYVLAYMQHMIESRLFPGISVKYFIVTPHTGQNTVYHDTKTRIPQLRDLRMYTANFIQGFDNSFVMVDIVSNANMAGKGSFLDKQRLAVMLTRQRDGMIVSWTPSPWKH
jgi:hypothetical protein